MELNKDIYEYILNFSDDRTILAALSTNRKFNDDEFFKRIILNRYPLLIEFKRSGESWKQLYIRMIYTISRLKEDFDIPYIPLKGYDPVFFLTQYVSKNAIVLQLLKLAIQEKQFDLLQKYLIETKLATDTQILTRFGYAIVNNDFDTVRFFANYYSANKKIKEIKQGISMAVRNQNIAEYLKSLL